MKGLLLSLLLVTGTVSANNYNLNDLYNDTFWIMNYNFIKGNNGGTAFFLKDEKLIVTNKHVIYGGDLNKAQNIYGEKHILDLVYVSKDYDLAFLKFHDKNIFKNNKGITICQNDSYPINTKVYSLGNTLLSKFKLKKGFIDSFDKKRIGINHDKKMMSLNISVYHGQSGSPIINAKDKCLMGVLTSKEADKNDAGYAVRSEDLKKELLKYKSLLKANKALTKN